MSTRRRLLSSLSILVIFTMLFSGLSLPPASAQGPDGAKRQVNAQTGKVSFIGAESGLFLSADKALGTSRPQDPAMALARRFGPEFGLKNPERELSAIRTSRAEDGRITAHYQQTYQGIRVMGGELIVNTNENGDLYSINGEVSPELALSTQAVVTGEQAKQTALQAVAKWYQKPSRDFTASEPALWIYDESLLRASTRPAELVWRMEITPEDAATPVRELVLINAQRGGISLHFNQVDTAWQSPASDERSQQNTPAEAPAAAPAIVKYEDLAVDEARNRIYGADKVGNKIDVIDMTTLSLLSSYLLVYGSAPISLDLSPNGSELAVAQSGSGLLAFINLTNGAISQSSSPLTSGSQATDVIYGRAGVLYALSGNGIHTIDLTVTPHAEVVSKYLAAEGYPYDQKFGVLSSNKNTLYFVTGTCCSGYNSLNKYDVSAGLAKPVLLKQTHIFETGYMHDIRLSLLSDQSVLVSSGIVYNTASLTPKARNLQWARPAINLPGRSFYVTLYDNDGVQADTLNFYDKESSYQVSTLSTGVIGTTGAIAATSNGNTIFVSSTGGMAKFTIGNTPPGISVDLPASQHQYSDLAIDLPRNRVYGTDVSGRIDVINMSTEAVVNSYLLPSGAEPKGIDLSPNGSELAIALNGLQKLLFMDPVSGSIIAELTPQLDDSIYYQNDPFDLIYGKPGRLYASGNPSSSGIDYIHVIDTATHTWVTKSPYPNIIRTDTEFVLNQSKTYLYANQTFSPNNIYIYDVQTDVVTELYKGPHGPVYAEHFTIVPDGSKIFTSNGQVWDSILQTQLGSLEGAPGKLIKYVPNKNIIVLSSTGAGGDVLKFIDPGNYRLLGTYTPSPAGTIHEMEVAPDGSRLIINIGDQVRVINLNLSEPSSLAIVSGSNQTAAPQTQFALPLKVRVQNYLGLPVSGITVTFTAPASGPSGKFANTNSNVSTAVSDASGIATSAAFSANSMNGGYIVQATAAGVAAPADFSLFNGTLKIKTYTANNGTSLPGTLLCDQTKAICTNGANAHADAAHKYAIGTYLLYATQHNRDSIDNNNMLVISTVHYDLGYDNAFWNGDQMVYGDAYGYPLADDVVAHELTHGVTQYESNLFYYYQSGAINESFSDLWGEYYDQSNSQGNDAPNVKWFMGEDVAGQGALRSMSDPGWYGDPDSITSFYYYLGEEDSGGVHTNSGVNNKAVYLMVEGGSFNGKTITSLGWTKAAAIYYEANTNLLTSGADYSDLYYALQTACANLIGQKGITAGDCAEVKDALDAVAMNGQPTPGFNTEAPVCTAGGIPNFVFTDDLESGTSNWTFSNGAYPRWQWDSPYGPFAQSGLHSLYADDYPDLITNASARLKPLTVPANAYLHFAHAYGFESGYNVGDPTFYNFDGGVLEYSINNGATWTDAGSLIDFNGYKGTLFTGAGNPLSGRSAFVGDSHGYISTRLNLASLAGKTVIFRWRMGLDEAAADWGWWVDNVKLYTCKVLPGVFNKISPSNGIANQALALTLRWGTSNAAASYQYCYDTTNDNACSNWIGNGTATSKALSGLSPGTTYYWHVRAVNSSGTTYANGSPTAFWSFTTMALPGAFSKTAPSNGSTGIGLSTTLSWGNSSSASSYQYCYDLSDDDQCSRTWVSTASTSAEISNLGTNTTYYWQVRAVNAAGMTEADGSSWRSFTTTPTLPAGFTTIESFIGTNRLGKYSVEQGESLRESFLGLNNGPVKITSNGLPLIGAERVIYKINGTNTSFTELMGLPDSQLDTTYWLPWYNNVDLDTQLRFANVSNATATVHVFIGGVEMGSGFTLAAGESTRQSFPGINNGPVQIVSDQNIVAAERVIYKINNINTSFSEMMALPNSQLDTTYWLPWYNNVDLDTQLRFANVNNAPVSVHVFIGGVEMTGSPFTLDAKESTRVSFAGVNNGPVKIESDLPIVAAERVIYKINNVNTSFSEMMALPDKRLDTAYWLPWYNNVDLDTQLRFANVNNAPATVHIYIGGAEMSGSPVELAANESTRISFAGINSGPVQVVSDLPIVAAERVIYKINNVNTSFSEMMGLPDSLLDTIYWLPWYNNVDLDTQLRFGVP